MLRAPSLLLLLAALSAACAGADEPHAASYRRVLAPANLPEAWPKTGEPWVPVQQEEAARLLRLADQASNAPRGFSAVSVRVEARVDARVAGQALAGDGEAVIDLNGAPDAFLRWPIGETRVLTASWAPDAEPALLGDWGTAPAPTHGVLVDRTGVLRFSIQCRPVSVTDTRAEYLIGLPIATTTTLSLDLPEGTTPTISRGIIREAGDPSGAVDPPSRPGLGLRRWEIKAAPGGPSRLVLTKASPAEPTAILDATQDLWHVVRESGVETRCRFSVRSTGPLPGAVRVALPAGAQLIRATQDSLPVEWSLSEEEAGGTIARLVLKRQPRRDGQIELTMVSPEAAGPLRLASPTLLGARWTEGTASVRFEEPIALVDTAQLAYAQLAPPPATAEGEPDLFFRLSRPEAAILLRVGPGSPAPAVTVARLVTLGVDHERDLHQAQSTVTIRFEDAARGSPRELTAALDDSWAVRSIEAEPSSALERWEVPLRRIDIHLAPDAFSNPTSAPTLTLTLARRTHRHDDATRLTDLLAVRPEGVRIVSDLLRLSSADPYKLRLRSAPPPEIPTDGAGALRYKTGRLPLAQLLAAGEVELVQEPTQRVSRCDVRIAHVGDAWQYQAMLTVPASAGADAARVRFEPPLPESAALWIGDQLRSRSELLASARDDSFPFQTGHVALPMEGRQTATFRITFTSQDQAPLDVPLPMLEAVHEQHGLLTIVGAGAGVAGLRSNGLTPLPPAANSPEDLDEKHFAYDPARVGAQDLSALLTRQSHGPVERPLRLLEIETRLLEAGRMVHHLTYRVRPSDDPCVLPLPSGAVLLSVSDDSGLAIEEDQDAGRDRLLFPAAGQARLVRLTLERAGLGWAPGVRLPLEGVAADDSSCWTWRFLTPDSHELGGPSLGVGPEPASRRHRLLGPVASVLGSGEFNPFAPATWRPGLASTEEFDGGRAAANCPPGWRCYEVACVGSAAPNLVVIHHDRLVGGAATLGVLVACLSAWWWSRAAHLLVTAALSSAVLALLLPGAIAVWGAAVWLGLIAGAMLCPLARLGGGLLRALRGATSFALPPTPTSTAVVLLAIAAAASGQPLAAPPLQTVLIPVDDAGQPAGDKWYLGGEFLRRLNGLANQERSAAPAGWVLERVTLRGGLRGQSVAAGVTAEPWTLALELWTSRRDTPIELPLRRGDAAWGGKASIDGFAAPLGWRDSGDACLIQVAEPGPHRVTISLTPNVIEEESGSSLRLALPRCSLSELRLTVPETLTGIRAPELASPLTPSGPGGALQGDLSGNDELLLRWGEGQQNPASTLLLCDQLQWLRLRPGGASLEVRCALEGAAPLPRSLAVSLPADAGHPPSSDATRPVALTPRTPWDAGLTRLTYGAEVELPRSSGLGRYSVTALPPAGAALRSRLMAVSSSGQLTVTTPAMGGVSAFDVEEFATRWSDVEAVGAPPDRAVVATDASAAWQVQADARPVEASLVDQRLRLVLGLAASTARLTISTDPATWPLGKLDVSVPDSFELIDCYFGVNGAPQPIRATRPEPSRVVVFWPQDQGAPPAAVLELYGRVTLPELQPTVLPLLRASAGPTDPLRVELWRLPDSLVAFADADKPTLEDAAAPAASDRERLVGSFRLTGQQAPRVVVTANTPRFKASQVTAHQRTAGGVRHSVTAKVRMLSGALHELAVAFPERSPDFTLASPVGATLTPAPGEGARRSWKITLPHDLLAGQEVLLRLEGEQVTPAGVHPASLAAFPGAAQRETLVALSAGPYAADGLWLTPELTGASGQSDAPTAAFEGGGWSLYQAEFPQRATVAWTRRDKRPPECLVRFSESKVIANPLGRVAITTRVCLDPNGAAACRLLLDEHSRLTSLDINGQAPIATREADKVWRVTLLSNQRPQALTATAVWDKNMSQRQVQPPRLITGQGAPLAVRDEVVSLRGVESVGLRHTAEHLPITAEQLTRARLQVIAGLSHVAPDNASPWWQSRLRDAIQDFDAARQDATSVAPLRVLHDDAEFADARRSAAGDFAYLPDTSDAFLGGQTGVGDWRRLRIQPGLQDALIAVSVNGSTGLASRVALALLAVAAGVCYHVGRNQPAMIELLQQRRNTAIALAGLAWWLWLPLGAFGLLLMASAAVDEGRARYRRILSRR